MTYLFNYIFYPRHMQYFARVSDALRSSVKEEGQHCSIQITPCPATFKTIITDRNKSNIFRLKYAIYSV